MLAATAAAMIIGGTVGMITQDQPGWPGIVLRSGIILAAIWVATPSLRRVRRKTWLALAIPALVLMLRPRLLVWGLAGGGIAWILTRWKRP